jgi:hypothetical protein
VCERHLVACLDEPSHRKPRLIDRPDGVAPQKLEAALVHAELGNLEGSKHVVREEAGQQQEKN